MWSHLGQATKISVDFVLNILSTLKETNVFYSEVARLFTHVFDSRLFLTWQILIDTKDVQKEINQLSGKLDRTFAVTDELIFRVCF